MATCIERYEPGVAAQWSSKLWEALKYEIFNLSDDSKAPNAMRVLTVIANRLSLGHELATIEGSPLQTYIYLVTTECLTRIREEGQKSSKSASRVLARIASASPFAYHLVIRATLPALLSQFEKSDTIISDKQCALEVINQLLDFRVNVEEMPEGSLKSSFLEVERSSAAAEAIAKVGGANVGVSSGGLRSYRDRLTSAFVQVARNPIVGERQYRITAMQGLSKLLQMKLYLDEEDIRSHVQYFASVIANSSEGSDEAQKEAVKALEGCAVVHPDELVDAALPILFADLPRKIQATENSTACIFILHAASRIFARSEAFTTLIKKLEALLMEGDMEEDEDDLCHNLKHTQWILAGTLAAVLQREKQEDLSFELRYETDSCLQWLMRHLVDNFFMLSERRIALRPIWSKIPQNDLGAQVIQLLGEIVMVCVRTGNGKQVFKPDAPLLPQVFGIKDSEALRYDIWNFDIPTSDQLAALVVVSGVVAGLPRQVSTTSLKLRSRLTTLKYVLLDISELNTSGLASFLAYRVSERVGEGVANIPATMRSSLLNLVAVLVNKHSHLLPPKDPQAAVDLQRSLLNPIGESEMSEDTIKNVIQVYAAITQAANMAGNKHTIALLNGLLDRIGFQNPTGMRFAQAFGAILSPSDILTSENNAIVRGLYKQRLFSLCVPKILEMFGQTQDEVLKSRYLAALGGILKNVPGDMIMPYIDRLLPFLLQSIDSGSESVKAVSIDVLRIASIESPDAVESHVSGIVKRLLACLEELLEGGYRCKPATRCKALVALGVLPKSLRMSVVLPCKKEVLGKLRESGEDKSRSVREKVVDCQMVWWKLAGVEEED